MTKSIVLTSTAGAIECQRCHKDKSLEKCGDECVFVKRELLLCQLYETLMKEGIISELLRYREKETALTRACLSGENFQDSLRNIRKIFLEEVFLKGASYSSLDVLAGYFEAEDERRKMAEALFEIC